MNIAEKILAKASGRDYVEPGEIVDAKVDKVMFHDLTGPMTLKVFEEMGGGSVWNPDRIVVIFDHIVPASSITAAENHVKLRKFVKVQGIKWFYDVGRGGICHQVMVEKGHVCPGELIIGADSHTCMYGALGAFATGVGATDMAATLLTGRIWLRVPEAVMVRYTGKMPRYLSGKDLILYTIGEIGADGANYKAVIYSGDVIRGLPMDDRFTMSNMAVEMGAKTGIVEPDDVTLSYLKDRVSECFTILGSDRGAEYSEEYEFDVSDIEPQVACPYRVDNVRPVSEVEGISVDQAFIGSCTNGRLSDLRIAAEVLKGHKVSRDTRLIVIPASQDVYREALREGLIDVLLESGAMICNPTCGPCIGVHLGVLSSGEVCIASINRNFIGRMGSRESKVYLASPATVAASAIEGRITDPRRYLKGIA
ncbi:MAG: 3-isopropylmalate dehydratase large subunit [Candidatus Bathyarchaeota archaeon]|nr:3-isopropylmalate dehydratase large subunit [Candidatus Bathyarchaeota archaeon]